MPDESSSSSCSSASSSSSGEIESPFALLEGVEAGLLATTKAQSYRSGDITINRPDLSDLLAARRTLQAEIAQRQGTRPTVASFDLRGNF